MLDRNSALPLYEQLVLKLKAVIAEQPIFEPIPSEKELAKLFGVSRGTVRKAIETLVAQGILARIQGKGTYVAPRSVPRARPLAMCELAELKQMGFTPNVRFISIVQALPPEQVRRALQIDEARCVRQAPPTWRVARLVDANGKPVYRVISYLRTDHAPQVKALDVKRGLISLFVEALGALPVKAYESIGITQATRTTAEMFRIAEGTSLLCVQRVAYMEDGRPVEYALRLVHPENARLYAEVVEDHPHRTEPLFADFQSSLLCNVPRLKRIAELAASDLPPLPWPWA